MNIVKIGDDIAALQQKLIDEGRATTEDTHKMVKTINDAKQSIAEQLVVLGNTLTTLFDSLEKLIINSAAERGKSLDEAIGIQKDEPTLETPSKVKGLK